MRQAKESGVTVAIAESSFELSSLFMLLPFQLIRDNCRHNQDLSSLHIHQLEQLRLN